MIELQDLCENSQKVLSLFSLYPCISPRFPGAKIIFFLVKQDDTRYQNQIQKLKSAWYTEQEMLIRELEENKASVVAERMEMISRIRAFESERFGLLEEMAKLRQKLRDAEQQLLQHKEREEQV